MYPGPGPCLREFTGSNPRNGDSKIAQIYSNYYTILSLYQKGFLASKYPQNAFAAGVPLRTPLGSSQRSPDPIAGLGEGKGRTPKLKVYSYGLVSVEWNVKLYTLTDGCIRRCISVAAAAGIDESAAVELKQPSRDDELVEGVELILKCRVDGNEEPTVDWYRNYDR